MPEIDLTKRLAKRLVPLYVSTFFQSFVLWYAIEKLFMRSIGFNNAGIGFMIAVYSAVMLAVETPSGILADRWSRKGVLMIAGVCLALSALVGGLAHGIGIYLIAAIMWGIFFACYSGIYDSITYDVIIEEGGTSRLFDRLYGRIQLIDSLGLVLGALAGGLAATVLGIRYAYFLSVPFALASVVVLIKFREPTLHKQQVVIPIKAQISDTLQAVLKNRSLLPVIAALILRAAVVYLLFEFSQLWWLALHTPTAYFGIANAVVLAAIGAGGLAAHWLRLSRFAAMAGLLAVMLLGGVGLIVLRNTAGIVAAQFVVGTSLVGIAVIFNRILHDNMAASIRAGASSAVSTISRFLIIPLALTFGYLSNRFSVYAASYVLLVLAALMALIIMKVAYRNGRTGLGS